MSLWSRIKKAAQWVGRKVKGFVRLVVKIIVTVVSFVINGIGSLFLPWLEKKIRIYVCILHPAGQKELVSVQEAEASVQRAAQIIKDRFDTKTLHYGTPYIDIIKEAAPDKALDADCSFTGYLRSEFGMASDFYSRHTAGWNAIPISLVYPVTVFVVRSVRNGKDSWSGCSFGLLTDYIVITPDGVRDPSTLAHEIGHTGFLLHRDDSNNLMHHSLPRGTSITGWQKWLFRTSRHVNFW
jgi:hypothetical protein